MFVQDFLELEIEVINLVLMLNVDGKTVSNLPPHGLLAHVSVVHNDCSSIVREYRCLCQKIHLLDDGYHRWAAESCEYSDLSFLLVFS